MKKLKLLRSTVLERLNLDAANVTTFIETGACINYYKKNSDTSTNDNFKLIYDAKLFVANYAGDVLTLLYIVNEFMSIYCSGHACDSVAFETEILNHDECDVLITIKRVKETAIVKIKKNGISVKSCDDDCNEIDSIARIEGLTEVTESVSEKNNNKAN